MFDVDAQRAMRTLAKVVSDQIVSSKSAMVSDLDVDTCPEVR